MEPKKTSYIVEQKTRPIPQEEKTFFFLEIIIYQYWRSREKLCGGK